MGPLTGRTQTIITGAGFKNSSNIIVRFSYANIEKEVEGIYKSEAEIVCETPAFDRPRKAMVHLSIDKRGEYTIT